MKRSTSNQEVKKLNRNRVFRYVNSREETSMPEISAALSISGPTVLKIVNELKEEKLIREVGEFESTGGRKAKAIAAVRDVKYAIGLDITKNHVGIVYTDLSGKALKHERVRKPFKYTQTYLHEVAAIVRRFVEESRIPKKRILGMGISVPAIIDVQRDYITNSHALGIYDVPCEELTACMPYPCELLNDANAAAITESNRSRTCSNLVYLFLSNTVGGAIIFGNETGIVRAAQEKDRGSVYMYKGNNWRSGEFGHMVIHPEGKRCYCGKIGCLDAYCSALRLADQTDGDLERFFREMEAGNQDLKKIWNEYLKDLAIAVDNLRMCFDCEIVLGGYVGSSMEPYIQEFRNLVAEKDIFENSGDYVYVCQYQKEASALGAAIFQIEKFIDTI